MKRVSRCLLGIAVAAWATACTIKGGTSPDPVPSSGPPARWTGTATFTYELETDGGLQTRRFDATVTWAKAANPTPAPPAGGARYDGSGGMHVSWRDVVEIGHVHCTIQQDWDFPLTSNPPVTNPDLQNSLVLGPDGQYQGMLYASQIVLINQQCSDGTFFLRNDRVELSLEIKGALDGGRMRGQMPPQVLTTSALKSTRTGSWDFTSS
jgi:hypothetical protein